MKQPIFYKVALLDGDYAHLLADDGEEILIARALLPDSIDEGSRLVFENFQYTMLKDHF